MCYHERQAKNSMCTARCTSAVRHEYELAPSLARQPPVASWAHLSLRCLDQLRHFCCMFICTVETHPSKLAVPKQKQRFPWAVYSEIQKHKAAALTSCTEHRCTCLALKEGEEALATPKPARQGCKGPQMTLTVLALKTCNIQPLLCWLMPTGRKPLTGPEYAGVGLCVTATWSLTLLSWCRSRKRTLPQLCACTPSATEV